MSDIGAPPELAWLPVDKLDVDERYQRSLDTPSSRKLIDKIASEFSWMKFQALLATRKPGTEPARWLLVDGQHRTAGARKRGGIPELPALVFASASLAEQAAAFVSTNRDRVPVSAQALFHARVLAGDELCRTVNRLCERAGIGIVRYNCAVKQLPLGKTAATPALLTALKLYGEAATGEAIAAIGECLRGDPSALRGPFFMAAARYLKNENGDPAALRLALRTLGLAGLERAGEGMSPNTAVASIIAALTRAAGRVGPNIASFAVPDRNRLMAGR